MVSQNSTLADAEHLLLIGFDSAIVVDLIAPLTAAGYAIKMGTPGDIAARPWVLVLCAPAIPGMGALDLLAALRDAATTTMAGLLVVGSTADLARSPASPEADGAGIQRLVWPFRPEQLVGTVQAMVRNRPVVAIRKLRQPARRPKHYFLKEEGLIVVAQQEHRDLKLGRAPADSFLVSIRLDELHQYRARLDPDSFQDVWDQLAGLVQLDAFSDQRIAIGDHGDAILLVPSSSKRQMMRWLGLLARAINSHPFALKGQFTHFSPVIGFAALSKSRDASQALRHARRAADQAALHMDMQPVAYQTGMLDKGKAFAPKTPAKGRSSKKAPKPAEPSWFGRFIARHTLVWQYIFTTMLGLVVPFFIYLGMDAIGLDISDAVYVCVVVMLVATALSIWAEGFLALKRIDPPASPASPYPAASAIIAAYLPNEAPIIEDTVRAFLRLQYPGQLQVILAYNTPKDMPEVEERLQQIARENPRFWAMRVGTSTSKAQNVNAALPYTTGEFIAVFDADHQPDPESFRRAWRWISHGADVVQGHCFIRNGADSWVSKMVAVEFEQIYAVSHPGRARLHGFGIFGGSNGYWRADLLRELRMHGFMLTEDIDSSMRAVVRGRKIISDPYLVSRELAPETLSALTKQRLRWAQGWFQISMKWVVPALRSPDLSLRQKIGMMQLLAWREVYPWVSMQILPLIAFWAVQAGSLDRIDWFVPLFVVTSLFTLTTGPGQIFFVYKLADPEIRKHRSWFWFFLFTSTFFYSGLKNAWGRMAHLKEAMGEKAWVVTARKKV
ncbi:MAG: glycosyltransferase [Pseudomonadota bacterium]